MSQMEESSVMKSKMSQQSEGQQFTNIYHLLSQIKANELIKTRYQTLGRLPQEMMDSTDELLNNMSEKRKRYLAKIAEQIDPENNIYKESIEKEMNAKGNLRKKVVKQGLPTFRNDSSLSSIDSYAYDNSSAEHSLSNRHK